jgi:hypothetical protein
VPEPTLWGDLDAEVKRLAERNTFRVWKVTVTSCRRRLHTILWLSGMERDGQEPSFERWQYAAGRFGGYLLRILGNGNDSCSCNSQMGATSGRTAV